jgi:hypothetical protein
MQGPTSPVGTADIASSAVPPGLVTVWALLPNVETLGYCRMSLRDKHLARACRWVRRQILAALDAPLALTPGQPIESASKLGALDALGASGRRTITAWLEKPALQPRN